MSCPISYTRNIIVSSANKNPLLKKLKFQGQVVGKNKVNYIIC